MSVRTLEVDGKTITALEGQTIFSAAWESGVQYPQAVSPGRTSPTLAHAGFAWWRWRGRRSFSHRV